MEKIIVRNPNTILPVGSWYPEEEEKMIAKKLLVVTFILLELNNSRDKVPRLFNHPIHDFTDYLWMIAGGGVIQVGLLEFLLTDIEKVQADFRRSRNGWVKERTQTALLVMNEIIYGDYTIDSSIYTDPNKD